MVPELSVKIYRVNARDLCTWLEEPMNDERILPNYRQDAEMAACLKTFLRELS